MSTYKELKGLRVKYVPTDTTAPSTAASGDVWYNTTTSQLKAYVGIAAWSAGSNMGTPKDSLAGGCAAPQTAGIVFGGGDSTGHLAETEEYNGSGWSEVANLNTAREILGGAGTQTAALAFGGQKGSPNANADESEEFDGSSWTEGSNLNTARYITGCGTQTAGLGFGGYSIPETLRAHSEEYNGTSWSEGDDLNTARSYLAGCGTQTAGLALAGAEPGFSSEVEEYNGTSWSEVTDCTQVRKRGGAAGLQTSALLFGGIIPAVTNKTESYDGTSWTNSSNMGTARYFVGGHGILNSAAIAAGGLTTASASNHTAATEEFNNSFTVVTAGAWASSGNMPVAVYGGASFGIQTSAVHSAGVPPANAADNDTYEYNGSTWSSGGALPANRQSIAAAGASETSGLAFCGAIPSNSQPSHTFHNNTYEYDGSSWTNGGNYPTGLSATGGSGTQTAAIGAGGTSTAPGAPGITNASATYDGSSWTAAPNTGTSATRHNMITGTTTSAVSIANYPPFGCEEFDGSSWTAGGTPNVADYSKAHTGTSSSDALVAGRDSAPREQCESYNGTTWATSPNVATGRASMGTGRGVNPTATKVIFGGYSPPGNHNQTEEFTPESSADTAKTIDFD